MEDYKGHVGVPAVLPCSWYGKCTAWKQLSIWTSCKVTWGAFCWENGGSVKKNQSSRLLTRGKDFVDPDNIPNNYSGPKKWAMVLAHCIKILGSLCSTEVIPWHKVWRVKGGKKGLFGGLNGGLQSSEGWQWESVSLGWCSQVTL